MRKESGFSLIEILVALTILAIALTACLMLTSRLSQNQISTQNHIKAQWIFENTLARIKSGELKLSTGKTLTGEEQQLNTIFDYQARIVEQRSHARLIEIIISLNNRNIMTEKSWQFLNPGSDS